MIDVSLYIHFFGTHQHFGTISTHWLPELLVCFHKQINLSFMEPYDFVFNDFNGSSFFDAELVTKNSYC